MLSELLANQVDPSPALRHQVVSAILLGGNVLVPDAPGGQGSFQHLAPCRSAQQLSSVIAYSSFPSEPPADALFGRPGQGPSAQSGQIATVGVKVLCVNPVALGGGVVGLDTLLPASLLPANPRVRTPWLEFPNLYTATCKSADGANWLNVTPPRRRTHDPV